MKKLWAKIKYSLTGKYDSMDLLDGTFEDNLPDRLTISAGMLKSEDLAYEAGDLVAKLYQEENDSEFSLAQKLRALPRHWGTLEALMYYDAMVNNGGHKQYFENSEGAYLDLVEHGLDLYGSTYHQNIFKRALYRYNPERFPEAKELDAQSKPDSHDLYDELDCLYFDANPKLPEMVDHYIRNNLKLYRG